MRNLHEVKTVRCAQCGRLKQETALWFVARVGHGMFCCEPLKESKSNTKSRGHREPACGQQCAQKLFERYLSRVALRQHSLRVAARKPQPFGRQDREMRSDAR